MIDVMYCLLSLFSTLTKIVMTSKKFIVDLKSGLRCVTQEDTWNGMIVGDKVKLIERTVEPEQMMARDDPQNRFFWLLGNLVGDGSMMKHPQTIRLIYNFHPKGNSKEEARGMVEYAKRCISDLRIGKAKGCITDEGFVDHFRTSCECKALYSKCREYLSTDKLVKDKIEHSPLICQAQFILSLYDADGHVRWQEGKKGQQNYRGHNIELSQSNKDLIHRVQRMLLNFGITSYYYIMSIVI